MDIDNHFSVGRVNGASPPRRSAPSFEALSDEECFANWPAWQETLQNLPDSRPEAVERARNLIADPDYPPQYAQEILARQLAVQLTAEIDPLPT